ncbi:MAG: hypothetical protein J0L81_04485 [Caulobacterales bacterium]|jgi:hypothetical protein|nr:hypothetical protein [Caulobacterales bacterium]
MRALMALVLAMSPMAGSCASTPIYSDWIVQDFCDVERAGPSGQWVRAQAPANAEAYRAIAARDSMAMDHVPEGAREYWFAAPNGDVKYCLTNLRRSGHPRFDWCSVRVAVTWVIRESEAGLVSEGGNYPVCLT